MYHRGARFRPCTELEPPLKLVGEIEVKRFFFSAMTFRVDNSEMQKIKKGQNSCSLPFVKGLFVKPVHLIKYR